MNNDDKRPREFDLLFDHGECSVRLRSVSAFIKNDEEIHVVEYSALTAAQAMIAERDGEIVELRAQFTTDALMEKRFAILKTQVSETAYASIMSVLEHHLRFHHAKEKSANELIEMLVEVLERARYLGAFDCEQQNDFVDTANKALAKHELYKERK